MLDLPRRARANNVRQAGVVRPDWISPPGPVPAGNRAMFCDRRLCFLINEVVEGKGVACLRIRGVLPIERCPHRQRTSQK
jgi:hypothetical protein